MTTYKGAFKTIADSVSTSHTNDSGTEGARLHVTADSYEAATLVTGSLVQMGSKLPLNAYVYEVILGYDALGSNTSLSVGDAEDDDNYITNTVTTSAGIVRLNVVDGMNYKIDETSGTDDANTDRQILVKVVDSGSATNTIKTAVFWAK